MKYQYLLFDLDGTLIDTTEGVFKCAEYALSKFNIFPTSEELIPFFGPPLKYSFTKLFGLSESDANEAIIIFRKRYSEKGINEAHIFPEIKVLLPKLKRAGYILGVATSKMEGYAFDILKKFGISEYFEVITGSSPDETISKKHEVIEECLKRLDVSRQRNNVLMIGDTKYDIEGAKTAKIDSFGIYTSAIPSGEHEQSGADYIAYSFSELEKYLLGDFLLD